MSNATDEEKKLLEILKLIDAHRNGQLDANQLEEAIWRVRSTTRLVEAPWLWKGVATLLAAAIVLYALL